MFYANLFHIPCRRYNALFDTQIMIQVTLSEYYTEIKYYFINATSYI